MTRCPYCRQVHRTQTLNNVFFAILFAITAYFPVGFFLIGDALPAGGCAAFGGLVTFITAQTYV